MAVDSVVVTKAYSEVITGAAYTYSINLLKAYAESITPTAYFPYFVQGAKVYAEIIASAAISVGPKPRRLVTTQVIRAR